MMIESPERLAQAALTVTDATDQDRHAWQAYVAAHPQATFFHRWEWRALMATQWRHRPVYLIARRGQDVCGVLPLAHMKTRLFGSQLVSLPFCVYGGPLVSDPQALAGKAMRRTAESVVRPVMARELPGAVAETATQCVLDAASPEEINALARDVGVEAGTQTVENIRNLASSPSAAACFARSLRQFVSSPKLLT